ncbi:MAG: hypothetical protein KF819_16045 [Labilithrix sp.]|nr:hypothetical protein [Labilithrix sp.]
MLDTEAFRDRMATLPHDLSEYARVQTGPASWSAHPHAEELSAWALEDHVDPALVRTTALLVDISPTDVPHVAVPHADVAQLVSHREAFVVASINGEATLETMLDIVGLPSGELLAIICSLCARGIVALDRSHRLVTR